MELNKLRDEIHQNAVDHGWWDEERHFGSLIALMHSELSEALEEYRNGRMNTWWSCDKNKNAKDNCSSIVKPCFRCIHGKPEGMPIELADCIIRILDYCGKEGIDIEEAIRLKMQYNKTRSYKHGGKKI